MSRKTIQKNLAYDTQRRLYYAVFRREGRRYTRTYRTREEAQAALWRAILAATRADAPDPDAAWQAHQQNLARRAEWLNAQQFAAFHYESGLGTDFTVGMPEGQNWAGGRSWTTDVLRIPKAAPWTLKIPS